MCQKCDIYWQKKQVQISLNFCTYANHLVPKKISKNNFLTGARKIVKIEFKFYKYSPNISQIFSHLKPVLGLHIQLVHKKNHILQPIWIATDSVANSPSLVDHIRLVLKNISKVKLGRRQFLNILSEIFWISRKWGRKKKVLYWKFYIVHWNWKRVSCTNSGIIPSSLYCWHLKLDEYDDISEGRGDHRSKGAFLNFKETQSSQFDMNVKLHNVGTCKKLTNPNFLNKKHPSLVSRPTWEVGM